MARAPDPSGEVSPDLPGRDCLECAAVEPPGLLAAGERLFCQFDFNRGGQHLEFSLEPEIRLEQRDQTPNRTYAGNSAPPIAGTPANTRFVCLLAFRLEVFCHVIRRGF